MFRKLILVLALFAFSLAPVSAARSASADPDWLEPMKKVHEGFSGTSGYVAQFGDSITYTNAFWKPMSWSDPVPYIKDDSLPKKPRNGRWRDVIKGAGDEGKGPQEGNYSGWRVAALVQAVPKVLADRKPEVAIIMIGTNDISGGAVPPDYRRGLERLVQMCIDAKCIPILNTIPPMRGQLQAVDAANKIIRDVSAQSKVPLVDYYAQIMARAPEGNWEGTLISHDGKHPSAASPENFSEENLNRSGYALRTWLNFLMFREVYFRVLAPDGLGP
jgi:lysophospholipase L1-like esterase